MKDLCKLAASAAFLPGRYFEEHNRFPCSVKVWHLIRDFINNRMTGHIPAETLQGTYSICVEEIMLLRFILSEQKNSLHGSTVKKLFKLEAIWKTWSF
jgi:hypothetical protein